MHGNVILQFISTINVLVKTDVFASFLCYFLLNDATCLLVKIFLVTYADHAVSHQMLKPSDALNFDMLLWFFEVKII